MRRLAIAFLTLSIYECLSQDLPLPISIIVKVEREYELKEKKADYAGIIRENDYVVNSDSVRQTFFDLNLIIKNASTASIGIWLMKCSYHNNFIINNNYMSVKGHGCDGNYPILVKFKPGEAKEYKFTLARSIKFDYPCEHCIYGTQVETTKLGLIIIDNIFENKLHVLDYDIAMGDKSLWRIIWSNSLQLLGKHMDKK